MGKRMGAVLLAVFLIVAVTAVGFATQGVEITVAESNNNGDENGTANGKEGGGNGTENGTGDGAGELVLGMGEGDAVLDDPETTCEGAWAIGEETFVDLGISMKWGWVFTYDLNEDYEEEGFKTDLWAGAGLNDTLKGTLVGHVAVEVEDGTLKVTYNMDGGYTLKKAHLYVGLECPTTAAPGELGFASGLLGDGGTWYTFEVSLSGLEGPLKMAAHADVCGVFVEDEDEEDEEEEEEGIGMPAKHEMTGQQFGEAVSKLAKTYPGAVADHVLEAKGKQRPAVARQMTQNGEEEEEEEENGD